MDKYLRIALFDEEGVGPATISVRGLVFADDKIVMAVSIEDLQRMLNKLNTSMKSMGLKVIVNKTKVMAFYGEGEKTIYTIVLNGKRIEGVDKYVYLGSLFKNNERWVEI